MNILTLVIAVAAWAQFHATNGQLQTMNRQLDEMRSSGKDTSQQAIWIINNMNWLAKEMHHSVQQAQSSIESARNENEMTLRATINTMRIDQRAWISVGSVGNRSIEFAADNPFIAHLGVINTGRTPARNVTFRYLADPVKTGTLPNFRDLPKAENSGIIGPGSWGPIEAAKGQKGANNLSRSQFEAIKAHNLTIFAIGRITYDDAFGFHHWSRFCYVFDPDSITLAQCKSDNDMDNELR